MILLFCLKLLKQPTIVKKYLNRLILICASFGALVQCKNTVHEKQGEGNRPILSAAPALALQLPQKPVKIYPMLDSLETLTIAGHKVDIRTPQNNNQANPGSGALAGNIIVLPGWNFPKEDWCNKSSLCKKALAKNYRLILPEMSKSVYSAKFYPQTRKDWQKYPDLNWVIKQMIPTLQKEYGILLSKQKNFLLGLSTGARGVVAIGMAAPELFKAGAALSGDYYPPTMPADRLMIGYLGTYYQYPERWKTGPENLVHQAKKLTMALYLGHGKQDKVVPINQSRLLLGALLEANPQRKLKYHWVDAGHNYQYWNAEVDNMLGFFDEFLKN